MCVCVHLGSGIACHCVFVYFQGEGGGLGAPFLVQGSKNPASFAVREECDL